MKKYMIMIAIGTALAAMDAQAAALESALIGSEKQASTEVDRLDMDMVVTCISGNAARFIPESDHPPQSYEVYARQISPDDAVTIVKTTRGAVDAWIKEAKVNYENPYNLLYSYLQREWPHMLDTLKAALRIAEQGDCLTEDICIPRIPDALPSIVYEPAPELPTTDF
jgi:hypothetical protein